MQKAGKPINELKAVIHGREALLWKEGKLWYDLKASNSFRSVSKGIKEPHKTWKAFVNEMGVPLSTVEYKIALYKKWLKELGYSIDDLKGIHSWKLHSAIPYVDSRKDAEKVLEKARALSFNDFLDWMKDRM